MKMLPGRVKSYESGKFYTDIFDMRQTGDYDDYIDFKKEDVLDLIGPANELISKIEILLSKVDEAPLN